MAMISLHADKISKTSIHILVGKSCAKAAHGDPSLPDGANLDDVSTGAAIFAPTLEEEPMFSVFKTAGVIAAVGTAIFASFALAAENPSTRVVVPDRPGGGGGIGLGACYQVSERLYGPYSMSFCLSGRGSYKVTGGGLSCNGSLSWSTSGRNISIKLRRSTCGRGQAWSADSMSCTVVGFFGAVLPRVIVPDRPNMPGFGDLACTYTPQPHNYKPVRIRARRT